MQAQPASLTPDVYRAGLTVLTKNDGEHQVNAEVPAGITPGGVVPVVLIQGGVQSNTATIAVQ